ncbi:MAG: TlpA family protein disulfide reductase [Myxococcales bacterium FL481]|nr:MAG: TlpA family protein disulfide reductase [Myxococcales bacterium FL481]
MTHTRLLRTICLAALGLVGTLACSPNRSGQPGLGAPAPRYAGVTLDGSTFELAANRGSVVLLNIWATWCPPCREELPELARIHRAFHEQRFTVAAISVDDAHHEPRVRALARDLELPFPIVLDPRSLASSRFAARAYPTSLLVDREGVVVWRRAGMIVPHDGDLHPVLRRTLNQRGPVPTERGATVDATGGAAAAAP